MTTTDRAARPGAAPAVRPGRLHRVGRGCARRPWFVIAAWLLVLVAVVGADRLWGGSYEDDFSLPGTSVQTGADLLDAHGGPAVRGVPAQIVLSAGGPGGLGARRADVEAARAELARLPEVLSVSDPLSTPGSVTQDGRTGYFTVRFSSTPARFDASYVDRVDAAVAPLRADGVEVEYGGPLGKLAASGGAHGVSEAIGVVTALVVLLLGFGSVAAAAFPLVSAVVGVLAGLAALGLAAAQVSLAAVSPTLAVMMGLGVGLDYALFLVTRHRKLLHGTADPAEAAGRTVATSGRAVLVAALTVTVALAGLFASGVGFIGMLGVAAATTVLTGALAALTLTPALLGLAGRRIDRFHVREPVDEPEGDGDVWHRWAAAVGRRPWTALVGGLLVLGVLAVPVAGMRLGHVDAGASPASSTERHAYDLIADGFGPGTNAPVTVVVTLGKGGATDRERTEVAQELYGALTRTPGVASATVPAPTADGALLVATVVPDSAPQDRATADLIHRLTDETLPDTLGPHDATGYPTGPAAGQQTFRDVLAARLPLVVGLVVAAAFLLLLVVFRSPLVAAKAALLNLLSIGASFGVVVAVFQWGWGGPLLGVDEPVPVESYVPMMMFAIVFGLSMDYEVFLLSRIREHWLATGDDRASVAAGLASTARVITCAAIVMTSVFLAFLLSPDPVVKMLALGLGVSVVLDATVVRLLLVPASMNLLGRANWWIPRRLDRLLPHLDPEGGDGEAAVRGAGAEGVRA
ncbi:MMPL family transporter [Streptomyces sp. WAC06614]|uniref:MMPL family transporter n=1 Tax=Streptomyces sp. WAC06614 TaxID=2487416 RepID=UPI000F7AA588|nr:MMPL family transporter [Streptomyces sp. WAC06614]RSS81938.1 MMPL family transporter [Streptomyces sp. WAC06614]